MKLLRLNRAGTYRSPAERRAERDRQINNSVQLNTPAFPRAARPSSGLVSGRRLRS